MVTGATSPIGSQADLYFQKASFGEALQQVNHVLFLEGKLILLLTLFVAKQICKSFTARLVNSQAVGMPRLNSKLAFSEDGVNCFRHILGFCRVAFPGLRLEACETFSR